MASVFSKITRPFRLVRDWASRRANRSQARRARVGRSPRQFKFQPEPRWIGDAEHAWRLMAGEYSFAGQEVKAPRLGPWKLTAPSPEFSDALHGFDWIEDFAAAGDAEARKTLSSWVFGWINQYGAGEGPGWTPALTGRRLMNWTMHAPLIMRGVDDDMQKRFFRSLGSQTRYLRKRWRKAPPGLARFEALAGLIYMGLSFNSLSDLAAEGAEQIGAECDRRIGPLGEIRSRNPEELERILIVLVRCARTLEEAGAAPDARHLEAIARIAPALRTLRFHDGGLARFHGGGDGAFGQTDHALAESGVRGTLHDATPMGYIRVNSGRTAIIMDVAPPPKTPIAHASTLAFEMSSGRRRLIVNSGHGGRFGKHWGRSSRATVAHSTLAIEKRSSAMMAPAEEVDPLRGDLFVTQPVKVEAARVADVEGEWILANHDGYMDRYGMTHQRRVYLSLDGRDFRGEDSLGAPEGRVSRKRRKLLATTPRIGIAFEVRFHLHPDVAATLSESGEEVSLALEGGETWAMRQEGGRMKLEDATYFDSTHRKPRATKQIVVTGRAFHYGGKITWAFRRTVDGESGARSFVRDASADVVPLG